MVNSLLKCAITVQNTRLDGEQLTDELGTALAPLIGKAALPRGASLMIRK